MVDGIDSAAGTAEPGVKVSVITAVYNGGTDMADLIGSLTSQTMSPDEFEVIFVDDDSTDDTLATLTRVAAEQPNVTVLHNTPNSGWPGKPRNMALAIARGEYVFFADHDDWLPQDSLQTMYDFALAHGTDVLLAKEVGVGQVIPWQTFRKTIPNARLGKDPLLRILTPHKLFRRALLDDNGIRFPEGNVRLEDHQVVMRAFFAAKVISIYADTPCYYWVKRKGTNISGRRVDPREYHRDVDRVLSIIEEHTERGELRNELYMHWYQRKMLSAVARPSFLRMPPEDQQGLVETIGPIIAKRIEPHLDERLSHADRVRAHLVRAGRLDLVRELAETDAGMSVTVGMTHVAWRDGLLHLETTGTLAYRDGNAVLFDRSGERILRRLPAWTHEQVPVDVRDVAAGNGAVSGGFVITDRDTKELVEIKTDRSSGFVPQADGLVLRMTARAVLDPATAFNGHPLPSIADVSLRFSTLGWSSERRVPYDADAPLGLRDASGVVPYEAYPTREFGKLSVRRVKLRTAAAKRLDPGDYAVPTAGPVVGAGSGSLRRRARDLVRRLRRD